MDIKNDKEKEFAVNDNGYVITTKVNYTSNKELVKQKIYLDKDINVTEVHVLNNENKVIMKMKFNDIDLKTTYNKNHFALKDTWKQQLLMKMWRLLERLMMLYIQCICLKTPN